MSKYSPPVYLLLTPKGFFFRLRVPRHLQTKIGKRELKKAIRTTDRALAERQAIIYAAQALVMFDSLSEAKMSTAR
jgi:hypothetical protein